MISNLIDWKGKRKNNFVFKDKNGKHMKTNILDKMRLACLAVGLVLLFSAVGGLELETVGFFDALSQAILGILLVILGASFFSDEDQNG